MWSFRNMSLKGLFDVLIELNLIQTSGKLKLDKFSVIDTHFFIVNFFIVDTVGKLKLSELLLRKMMSCSSCLKDC